MHNAIHITSVNLSPDMATKIRILEVVLYKLACHYKIYAEVYNQNVHVADNNVLSFRIRTLHDYYFATLRILLKESDGSRKCLCYSDIPFRRFEEGKSKCIVFSLFDAATRNECATYDFQPKKRVGKIRIHYRFTREPFDSCLHTGHEPNFIDKIFDFLFVNEKDIKISVILRKALEITRGTMKSKIDIFKGWLVIQSYYRKMYSAHSLEGISSLVKELGASALVPRQQSSSGTPTSFNLHMKSTGNGGFDCDGFRLFEKEFYMYFLNILYYSLAPYGARINNFAIPKRSSVAENVVDDLHKAILSFLAIPSHDLILVNLNRQDKKSAFIAFLHKESIVISFRGTANPRDISFDLKFEYSEFYEGYAHDGVKRLGKMFIREHWDEVRMLMSMHGRTKLIITGHSLGGGVALLVGYIIFRENLVSPEMLEVVAYSPVPIMSKNLVQNPPDNFTSFTYENDIVPSLSYGSVCDMKYLCCSIGSQMRILRRSEVDIGEMIERIREFYLKHDIHPKLYIPSKIVQFRTFLSRDKTIFFRFLNAFGWRDAKLLEEKVVLAKVHGYSFSDDAIFDQRAVIDHIPRLLFDAFEQSIQICEYVSATKSTDK